jgi:hypothetical protein
LTSPSYLGHGFCITCIDTLFAGASLFKCPTCCKHIHRNDALQKIFLNLHRSPTQHTIQSTRREAHAYATELTRLRHGYEQLQGQVLTVNEERDASGADYRALQQKHAALKSYCIELKSQCSKSQREFTTWLGMCITGAINVQQWKERCEEAQADALTVRKEKEIHNAVLAKLAELREREFERHTHAHKIAVGVHSCQPVSSMIFLFQWQYDLDRFKNQCDAHRQEVSQLQNNSTNRGESRKAVLAVDRGVVDGLQHAVMGCLGFEGTSQARRMLAGNSKHGQVVENGHNTTI